MAILKHIANRLSIVKELIQFFWSNKLWWMIPFVLVLLFIGVLVIFAQSSPVAPFLYAAF